MHCARELGLPIEDMMGDQLKKMGLTAEQMTELEDGVAEYADDIEALPDDEDTPTIGDDGGAPSIDMKKLFAEAAQAIAAIEGAETDGSLPEKKKEKKGKGKERQGEKKEREEHEFLDKYCKNLTEAAKKGQLDAIIGRENEIARVIQILCRRQKNNPCLIGEPGVGKTAIAEGLAQKIVAGDVPYKLRDKQLYLVDLTAIVAGTQFRGQFEQRMMTLIKEVKSSGNVILVIDEVHNIVGAGDAEGSVNAANILKPALSRGEVHVIGATTLKEYRKYIEKDSALERRFQPVNVNEPSVEDAVRMLRGISHYYEEYHRIRIPDDVLRRAVALSERYITDRYLPDKAIDLLDEAAAELSISSAPINESAQVRAELLKLKEEREAEENSDGDEAPENERYEKIANLRSRELVLSSKLAQLEGECEKITLDVENLAHVIEVWTGVPATAVKENEFERIEKLGERIARRVVGQDAAIDAVARAVKRSRAGISYKRKPVSFIFAGPTGVGKTELVKVLSEDLFSTPETLIRFDMSEFMEKHTVSRLIGSPPGYVGYDDVGQLTEKIRRRPYSVVLFDEIEKAHPDVLNILLQILDDGRITDAQGRTVDFSNTVIVMTTNAGSAVSSPAGFTADGEAERRRTEKALLEFLRPEFINRVDEIITFNSLSLDDFVRIAGIMLSDLASVLAEKYITLEFTDSAEKYVADGGYSPKYGARNMRRFIQKEIEDKIASQIVAKHGKGTSKITLDASNGELCISYE